MKIAIIKRANTIYKSSVRNLWEFVIFLFRYIRKKLLSVSIYFEKSKNKLVKLFLVKRGRYNRPFLHFATMLVLFIGVIIGPFLADTYPIFASNSATILSANTNQTQSIEVSDNVFETQESAKPRDKIIVYTVQKGDTIGSIAQKFQISSDTIRWANDLSADNLSVGDELKILPVTGIAYKVQRGDNVKTIAQKFDTDAQKIVDFPFNDFQDPETFSLIEGQILIVPDGIKPTEKQNYIAKRMPIYVPSGPVVLSGAGFTWPLQGSITQFPTWYHNAYDIAAPYGSQIVAAQNGTVTKVSTGTWDYGYGNNVYVTDGNGMGSHYAHMSAVNVSEGQNVVAGQTVIGSVGLSGRTTGPHLHFEVIANGTIVNPSNYLR